MTCANASKQVLQHHKVFVHPSARMFSLVLYQWQANVERGRSTPQLQHTAALRAFDTELEALYFHQAVKFKI